MTKFSLVHVTRKKKRAHPERDLHKALGDYLDLALPSDAWHCAIPGGDGGATYHPAYRPGAPDHIIIWNKRAFFIELKAGKKGPTELQLHTHKTIAWAGSPVLIARTVKEVERWLVEKGMPLKGTVQ